MEGKFLANGWKKDVCVAGNHRLGSFFVDLQPYEVVSSATNPVTSESPQRRLYRQSSSSKGSRRGAASRMDGRCHSAVFGARKSAAGAMLERKASSACRTTSARLISSCAAYVRARRRRASGNWIWVLVMAKRLVVCAINITPPSKRCQITWFPQPVETRTISGASIRIRCGGRLGLAMRISSVA